MENYVGKRIDGRYEIQDVVGVGGMAVVYKAYDNIDDRIVAVKILKDEYLTNEEFRRRFKNESKAIAVLNHRNIVKVYDVSFGDRLQYIVMEYIEGISLKEYIEQKRVIDWNEALFFSIQILRALQHAHDKGIVHRDVKPQNIMLLEDGTIKVTDFGIARFSHSDTRTMTEKAIGSVHYMSPEQAKGELTDEKADIYSVGIVLYEMLTGKLPFEADSVVSVALMQVNNIAALPRTINSKIPVGFEQIVMKAMQKNTRERYQTAAEMLLDLEEFKKNPNIKFDYINFFVDDQPTRYINKVPDEVSVKAARLSEPPVKIKTVQASQDSKQKLADSANKSQGSNSVPKKKRKGANPIPIIAGILVALLIFGGAILVVGPKLGWFTLGVGKEIEVVNFVGMNYEKEIKDNEKYSEDFRFQVEYKKNSEYESGVVFSQDPGANETIKKGSVVLLYVAVSDTEEVVIPDYEGQGYQSVQKELEAKGFTVVLAKDTTSDKEIGQVTRTDPAWGSSVLPGTNIIVYYAADASDTLFSMPNLTGKSLDEAIEIIEKSGLVLDDTKVVDTSADKDMVVMQSPKDGSPVEPGDKVTLTVSSGKTVLQKSISLPKAIGNVVVKVTLNDEVVSKETVNTDINNNYTMKISGDVAGKIKLYINDELYFSADADFTKDPVQVSNEQINNINFYTNVVGLTEEEARNKLSGYSNRIDVYPVVDNTSAEGTVCGQYPVCDSAKVLDDSERIILYIAVKNSDVTTESNGAPGA